MSLVPSDDELARVEALQDIVLIGYPNGIWDSVNNMPIFRRGTTATHLRHDYEGKPEFMIDAACFPGSSGSPVLIVNDGMHEVEGGGVFFAPRLKLLGILLRRSTASGDRKG